MKTITLKFKTKEEAFSVLIPLDFGFNHVKTGPELLNNIMGNFSLIVIPDPNYYYVRIDLYKYNDELLNKLKEYEVEL